MSLALLSFKRGTAVNHRAGKSDIRAVLKEMGVYEVLIGQGLQSAVQGAFFQDGLVQDLQEHFVNLLFMQVLLTIWTTFLTRGIPSVNAEFTEDLITFITGVRLEN